MTTTPPSPPLRQDADGADGRGQHRPDAADRLGPALYGLLGIAIFFALDAAAQFVIPVVAAFILYLLLSPASRLLCRLGVPKAVAAMLIVPVTVGCLGAGVYALGDPAAQWFARAPTLGGEVRDRVRALLEPVQKVKTATENVEKAATVDNEPSPNREVTVKPPSLTDKVFAAARDFGAGLIVAIILTFFFLAYGDDVVQRLLRAFKGPEGAAETENLLHGIERDVSVYLGTVTAINICLGTLIALGLHFLGFPSAALWGAIAAVANFVPYFGPIVAVCITAIAGLISVHSIEFALAGPLLHAGLNFIEGQFVTPLILGKRLTVSPIVIFLWVAFWGWLWGIAGALMAVPILLLIRAVANHMEALHWLADILGNGERGAAAAASAAIERRHDNATESTAPDPS